MTSVSIFEAHPALAIAFAAERGFGVVVARQDHACARAIVGRMVALRPHLLYEGPRQNSARDSSASPCYGGGI